jgi:hypothetical protein
LLQRIRVGGPEPDPTDPGFFAGRQFQAAYLIVVPGAEKRGVVSQMDDVHRQEVSKEVETLIERRREKLHVTKMGDVEVRSDGWLLPARRSFVL